MPPGPKPKANSKRNDPDWIAATLFLKDDMKKGMKKLQALQELTGVEGPADQSEIVDAALRAYLGPALDRLELGYRKG